MLSATAGCCQGRWDLQSSRGCGVSSALTRALLWHPPAQALPYSWTLFYVPMHFLTHEMLLFFTSIWTTNIHDNIHAKVGAGAAGARWCWRGWSRACGAGLLFAYSCHRLGGGAALGGAGRGRCADARPALPPDAQIAPVMGAGYHTIHHTLYNYNYGHYFTFVDRWGVEDEFRGCSCILLHCSN